MCRVQVAAQFHVSVAFVNKLLRRQHPAGAVAARGDQALGKLRPIVHGQWVPLGQHAVEHGQPYTGQAADAGLRNAEANSLVLLQNVAFEVGKQRELVVAPGQRGVRPGAIGRKLAHRAIQAVIAAFPRKNEIG